MTPRAESFRSLDDGTDEGSDAGSDAGTEAAGAAARPARARRKPGAVARDGAAEGSLEHYFREIAVYPLISREEEAALARRIRVGDQG
ncbi:MAG: sigma-70 factor domain-containing protein, partial [Gemmatirosa sp.]